MNSVLFAGRWLVAETSASCVYFYFYDRDLHDLALHMFSYSYVYVLICLIFTMWSRRYFRER